MSKTAGFREEGEEKKKREKSKKRGSLIENGLLKCINGSGSFFRMTAQNQCREYNTASVAQTRAYAREDYNHASNSHELLRLYHIHIIIIIKEHSTMVMQKSCSISFLDLLK